MVVAAMRKRSKLHSRDQTRSTSSFKEHQARVGSYIARPSFLWLMATITTPQAYYEGWRLSFLRSELASFAAIQPWSRCSRCSGASPCLISHKASNSGPSSDSYGCKPLVFRGCHRAVNDRSDSQR